MAINQNFLYNYYINLSTIAFLTRVEKLFNLKQKNKKFVIGLMSGTSLDGVDAALVEITGCGLNTKLKLIDFVSPPFPNGLKETVIKNSLPGKGAVTDICRLNFLLPHLYFDAIKTLLKKAHVSIDKIDLIGTHGQTIHHRPKKENFFGHTFGSTLQIGDPSVLAKLSGIVTIGDFRVGDIALGGEGAPLIPYFDYLVFGSKTKNRILLNIGGISNFTILAKNSSQDEVFAFDTGPGNMLTDFLAKKLFGAAYDKGGKFALNGNVDEKLFNDLVKKDKDIELQPPKSTGREYYNDLFLDKLLKKYSYLQPADLIASVSKLTPYAIYRNYEKFFKDKISVDELIISGGGAKNKFFIKHLQNYFGKNVLIKNTDHFGISSDAKEAICFAVLANETVSGIPANIPNVTGAAKKTILGKICLP
jgi:anhydro-N-acetylmuramic acid kinase